MRKKKFLDKDKRRIKKLYESGKSTREIGGTFNCSKTPILRILDSMGDISVRDNINRYGNEKLRKNIPKGKLKELYNKKEKTIEEIAQILNVSNFTVQKRMRKYDIEGDYGRNKRILTEKDKEKILDLYKKGLSTYDISGKFPVSPVTIRKWLKKKGIKLRGNVNYPSFNYTPSFGYVLGVIAGDGSVTKKSVQLKVIDEGFADEFRVELKEFTGLTPSKHQYEETEAKNPIYEVCLSSVKTVRKLNNCDYEDVFKENSETRSSFVRGFFDSDGTVSETNIRFDNTDKELLNIVKKVLASIDILSFDIRISEKRKNTLYNFHIPIDFTSHFLQVVGTTIPRKEEKIKRIIKNRDETKLYKMLEFLRSNKERWFYLTEISNKMDIDIEQYEVCKGVKKYSMFLDDKYTSGKHYVKYSGVGEDYYK